MVYPFINAQVGLFDIDVEKIFAAGQMECAGFRQAT
jgi:hypothetical protein